jgi:esterase
LQREPTQQKGSFIAELAAAERPDKVVALALLTPIPLAGAHLPEAAVATFKSVGDSAAALRALRLQVSPHFPERELARISEAGAQIAADAIPGFVDLWNLGVARSALAHSPATAARRYPRS